MTYSVLKALAQWYSRAVQALVTGTSTLEDSIVNGIQKIENAAWDVEGRIHEKALSAAAALANKEHIAIQKAHDEALTAVTRARAAYGRIVKVMDSEVRAIYDRLDDAHTLHRGDVDSDQP
jgi:hypothetical protein